jgi:hypothetical protein
LVKENVSSKKLFHLTLEVRQLEMREGASILVSPVSGKRMKAQGTDGVSRGQLKEGVSVGESMLSFILFHLTSIECLPEVDCWLRSWLGASTEIITPKDWFKRGHDILGEKIDEGL